MELVFVIAFLALGITSALRALSYATRMSGVCCDLMTAVLLVQEKAREAVFWERRGFIKASPVDETGAAGRLHYSVGFTDGPQEGLRLWRAQISWASGKRPYRMEMVTYLRR